MNMANLAIIFPQLAHFLIGFYFTFFGVWNIYHWIPMTETMMQRGLPRPFFLLSLIIVWQIIAGVMLIFGILIKFAALTLIPFVFMMVFILHPFWKFKGEIRKQHMALFITNLTICPGALVLLLNSV
jgi:putative oxidoreductase